MGALLLPKSLLVGLFTVLLATSISCSAATLQTSVVVFGKSECLDCAEKNIDTQAAFKGLYVAIKCKTSNGEYETKVASKLRENGAFKVQLPADLLSDSGELKQECGAQLHGVSDAPCPDKSGLNPSMLVLKNTKDGIRTFTVAGKIPFSSATCASAFFLLHKFHHPIPTLLKKPLPKWDPFHKFHHPLPPIFKKPCPPTVPIYKPPVFKKPCPPFPYHKSLPPFPKFPPIHKKAFPKLPPVYHKPLPPFPQFPPIHKKPFPKFPAIFKKPFLHKFAPIYKKPLPKFPPIFKKPILHKFPPIYKKPFLKFPPSP